MITQCSLEEGTAEPSPASNLLPGHVSQATDSCWHHTFHSTPPDTHRPSAHLEGGDPSQSLGLGLVQNSNYRAAQQKVTLSQHPTVLRLFLPQAGTQSTALGFQHTSAGPW
jgi:hypothetical protein